ncbi:MAG TPA: hypothetical protein PKD61_24205 [Polyangiaceae bacterium]|nr:hypothetical protein [Polyangiaceae bacterium]
MVAGLACVLALCAIGSAAVMIYLWRMSALCAATPGCRSNAGIVIVLGYGSTVLAIALSTLLAAGTEHPARRYAWYGNVLAVVMLLIGHLAIAA